MGNLCRSGHGVAVDEADDRLADRRRCEPSRIVLVSDAMLRLRIPPKLCFSFRLPLEEYGYKSKPSYAAGN
jgi:hypothetical protein